MAPSYNENGLFVNNQSQQKTWEEIAGKISQRRRVYKSNDENQLIDNVPPKKIESHSKNKKEKEKENQKTHFR